MQLTKKSRNILIGFLVFTILLVCYLLNISHHKELPNNMKQVFMKDSKNGWGIVNDGELLSTNNAWKTYKQIYKFRWNAQETSIPSITYVDNTLFVVGFSSDHKNISILSSKDEGNTWRESYIDFSDVNSGANQLFTSFIDSQNGYILYCGGAAAGQMKKILFKTTNGGKSFQNVADLTYINGYPTGMSFNTNGIGFIASTYHGNDNAYLYRSVDEGMTWNTFTIQPQASLKDISSQGYINGYVPCFIGRNGIMILEYVDPNPSYIIYYSSDNGETWSENGNVNIKSNSIESIASYSFSDKNTLFIIDNEGNMMKKNKSDDT